MHSQPLARWRLSLLMFLQYSAPGAWIPLLTLRLQELEFTPLEIGWVCATQALAALVAPFVAGQAADRWWPAEWCLAACAFCGSALLWMMSWLTGPFAVFWTSLALWLAMAPAITLGTAVSFAHLAEPERDFGRVRLWGTVGWVLPGWLLGYWFRNPVWMGPWLTWLRPNLPESELADIFRLAAVGAFCFAVYALTLPITPPGRQSRTSLAPLAAVRLMRERSFAVYCLVCLGWCVTIPFSAQVTPLFLNALGIPRAWLPQTLTLGQAAEIAALAVLPMLFLRLGLRGTMLLGLLAWALMLATLAVGQPLPLMAGALVLSGLCVCCFLVSGQVFVNRRARGDIRASAQALLSFINGLGMLAGNLLVGWVRREVDGAFAPTYAVGAILGLLLVVVFGFGFEDDEAAPAAVESAPLKNTAEVNLPTEIQEAHAPDLGA